MTGPEILQALRTSALNPWTALWLSIACAFIYFFPEEWADDGLVWVYLRQHHGWVLVLGLFALASVIASGLKEAWALFQSRRTARAEAEEAERRRQERVDRLLGRLAAMSVKERLILWHCVASGSRTVTSRTDEAGPIALVAKRFLVPADQGDVLDWPFIVSDLAWEVLQENRDRILSAEQAEDPKIDQKAAEFVRGMSGNPYFRR